MYSLLVRGDKVASESASSEASCIIKNTRDEVAKFQFDLIQFIVNDRKSIKTHLCFSRHFQGD
jgi:hypothetical protein